MIINHNMNAMNAHRNMGVNVNNSGKSMEKLSSGLRINRAGDDAAGLAISEKMRGQIKGLDQASRNAQDGISMIQTAEGALNETQNILQRMRELSVQAGNDTNTVDDRKQIQQEINQLTNEVNRISNTTEFNTQKLLNKDGGTDFTFQIGANEGQSMTINIGNMSADALGLVTEDKLQVGVGATDAPTANLTVAVGTKLTVKIGTEDVVLAEVATGGTAQTVTVEQLLSKVNDALKSAGLDAKVEIPATGETGAGKFVVSGSDSSKVGEIKNGTNNLSGAFTQTTGDKFVNEINDGTSNTATGSALDVSTHEKAKAAIKVFDKAINSVSTERAKLGSFQNRLEHTIANVDTSAENLQAAESRIRDVDMAKEMLNFSKNNILQQAAQSMLSQAKQQPEGVLQLLR